MTGWTIGSALRGTVSSHTLVIALSAPLAVAGSMSCAYAGGAIPASGQYVAGSGTIGKAGTTGLTINQSSNSGIINWNSFSIGKGNSVQFNNGSGATLNRVTGGDLSTIAGSLKGTGSVYLINPRGVIVTNTGKVFTGGTFVGSTRDESNDDFTNGKRHFTGTSKGNVVNQGTITSANGDVTLIGNAVNNSGSISATNGTASLNAGNDVLLAPAGSNGRIMVSGGNGDATNSGTISAAQAQLNAAGGNVYALGGNNGGIVRATGTQTLGGHVWLTSGSGNVSTAGTITATNANDSGGTIESTGANIATSGTIDASATTAAQAGGTVHVVSTGTTKVGGTIKAAGGTGAGGKIETSGHVLTVGGSVSAGQGGQWLLDPTDLTVDSTAATTIDNTLGAGTDVTLQTTASGSSGPGTANASGSGDIIIANALNWSTSAKLTLDAYRNIDINAPITISGAGKLALIDADHTGTGVNDGVGADGSLSFGLGSSGFAGHVGFGSTNNGGTLSINGASYTLLYNASDVQAINASGAALQGNYALATSVDATSATNWISVGTDGAGNIGNSGAGFSGTFEGLGNTISNLTINSTSSYEGLFGYSTGTIRDIGLANLTTSPGGDSNVGALAGVNSGKISDAWAAGNILGGGDGSEIGGLVGDNNNTGVISNAWTNVTFSGNGSNESDYGGLTGLNLGTISNAHASGAIDSEGGGVAAGSTGGLVGKNGGAITNAYASGAVSGNTAKNGGLVGENESLGTITNSYATGTADGDSMAGGLVGKSSGTITGAYATGVVSGDGRAGGLVGINSSGTISNSHASGAVSGQNYAGGLIGEDDSGTIENVWASGATSNTGSETGGLIGNENHGTISGAYSTGAVSDSGNGYLGGLVGVNDFGTISNVWASGSVTGSDSYDGGLVGDNEGTITAAYATGMISGGTANSGVGGLAGMGGGTFNHSYWDTDTSGLTVGIGVDNNNQSGNVVGKHTGLLQGTLPSGFSNTVWHTAAGLYPYLTWQSPSGTPRVISGVVSGASDNTGLSVGVRVNGVTITPLVSMATGANDYYYDLLAPGAISSSGSDVLAYVAGSTTKANRAYQNAKTSLNSFNLVSNQLTVFTSAANQSGVMTFLEHAHGPTDSSDFLYSSSGNFTSNATLAMTVSAPAFTIDQGIDIDDGNLTLSATGTIMESGSGEITAIGLSGSSVGGVTLTGANQITEFYNFNTSNGNFTLNDDSPYLSLSGLINVGAGALALNAPGANVTQNPCSCSKITAGTLTGSANNFYLYSINSIAKLGAFDANGGYMELVDDVPLYVSGGNVSAGRMILWTKGTNLALNIGDAVISGDVDLIVSGSINESSAGVIAGTLEGNNTSGSTTLNGANQISALSYSAGNFALTNTVPLNVGLNAINATLTTTGTGSALTIGNGGIRASGTLNLISSGTIVGTGNIAAAVLTGSSVGGATLARTIVPTLGNFTNTGGDGISINDGITNLTISGVVNAGTGTATLQANSIIENGLGKIIAGTLTGSSVSTVTLNGANQIGTLGAFSNNGGGISLNDTVALNVNGNVSASGRFVSLTTTGAGSDLSIGNVTITGSTVGLVSSGIVYESAAAGSIHATTLQGSSVGGATLTGVNQIGTLGAFTNTGSGGFAFSDGQALTVGGAVNAGTGLATLLSTGTITESSTGKITAATLSGSSVGGAEFTSNNLIGKLASFSDTSGHLWLRDAEALYVSGGSVHTPGTIILTTTAGNALNLGNTTITAAVLELMSGGTINQTTTSGSLHIATLMGSSVGGASLNGANLIGTLSDFANTGAGNFTFIDGEALTVSGAVSVASSSGTLGLTTTAGDLTTNGSLTAPTVTLTSVGEVLEGSAGSVTATNTLNVTANTGINLNSTHNHIHAVGTRHTTSGPNVIAGIGM